MVLSPKQWREAWEPIDPHKADEQGLGRYVALVDSHKAKLRQQYPGVRWDNARYVVHLEQQMGAGWHVPDEYVATVTEDDLRYDGAAFPLLNARREFLACPTT